MRVREEKLMDNDNSEMVPSRRWGGESPFILRVINGDGPRPDLGW